MNEVVPGTSLGRCLIIIDHLRSRKESSIMFAMYDTIVCVSAHFRLAACI